jgi:exodeoxyribonuclease-1
VFFVFWAMLVGMNPKQTFFFYDLETSGLNPKKQRIMQFAGQRTDLNLNPIGEPTNIYVALADDVLPEPDAVLITGITPQKANDEGYSEADFVKILSDEICTPGTIVVGFNNVRFDDEYLRYTLYRNFYDPYEWSWADGRSRWDMLDVVRMTRALRPEGIEWPVDIKGVPTNRLELLTKANGLDHEHAHDAMNDVYALISITRLIKSKQPKLFDYLFQMRNKREVEKLVNLEHPQPFVYASGRYPSEFEKTSVAYPIAPGSRPGSVLVYDLRHDPTEFAKATPKALASTMFADWETRQQEGFVSLPVKELAYNKCPAVAPLGVLDEAAQKRIKLDMKQVEENLKKLQGLKDFGVKVREAFELREPFKPEKDVDAQLYDGFMNNGDKGKMSAVRAASAAELADFHPDFADERLSKLLVRYKARNYPQSLNEDERAAWEEYRSARLKGDMAAFGASLQRLAKNETREDKLFLLSELQLWAESIVPIDEA